MCVCVCVCVCVYAGREGIGSEDLQVLYCSVMISTQYVPLVTPIDN